MEPTYTHTELEIMFYEWLRGAHPHKFHELTPEEKDAVCQCNFKKFLACKDKPISERIAFPEHRN